MSRRAEHDIYTDYYLNQAGYSNIYAGPSYQRGYGVGSFLGGLFRTVYPLLKKGTVALGSELLKTGASCISDLSRNEDPKEVFKKRGKETVHNLGRRAADHMFGSGYKSTLLTRKRSQSSKVTKGVKKRKIAAKKNKKKPKKKPAPKKKKAAPKKKKKKTSSKKRSKRELLDIFS